MYVYVKEEPMGRVTHGKMTITKITFDGPCTCRLPPASWKVDPFQWENCIRFHITNYSQAVLFKNTHFLSPFTTLLINTLTLLGERPQNDRLNFIYLLATFARGILMLARNYPYPLTRTDLFACEYQSSTRPTCSGSSRIARWQVAACRYLISPEFYQKRWLALNSLMPQWGQILKYLIYCFFNIGTTVVFWLKTCSQRSKAQV